MNDYEWIGLNRDRVVADHRVMAEILNISSDALSQHVKRGNIKTVEKKPGRGRSHEYRLPHALHAAFVVELSKYGLRHTAQNQAIIDQMVELTLEKYSFKIPEDWIDDAVYFVIEFDEEGEIHPQLRLGKGGFKGMGSSAIVIGVTAILADLLPPLKAQSRSNLSNEITEFVGD